MSAESERNRRREKNARLHVGMEARDRLLHVTEFPDNPTAMEYFYRFFERVYCRGEKEWPADRPAIGTMCVQVPVELIRATGAHPARLCSGAHAYDQLGGERLPARSCPLARATAGLLSLDADRTSLAALVIPTTCDQKRKLADRLAEQGWPVHRLEMPAGKESDLSRFFWQESVKGFARRLETITGHRLTRRRLREEISRSHQAGRLFRRLHDLQQNSPPVIFGKDILLVNNAYFLDDLDHWCRQTEELIRELERRKQEANSRIPRSAPRLLLTGSPQIFPNFKLPLLLEESGGVIVADELCSSARLLNDFISYDEPTLDDMVAGIADRYLKPCTCPCLTPNSDRPRRLRQLIRKFHVDGVICQTLSGCIPYEMEREMISSLAAGESVPVLQLETDYSPEDSGQLSTRIEAFIESIKVRRRMSA